MGHATIALSACTQSLHGAVVLPVFVEWLYTRVASEELRSTLAARGTRFERTQSRPVCEVHF